MVLKGEIKEEEKQDLENSHKRLRRKSNEQNFGKTFRSVPSIHIRPSSVPR